jgi:hypothetical protein
MVTTMNGYMELQMWTNHSSDGSPCAAKLDLFAPSLLANFASRFALALVLISFSYASATSTRASYSFFILFCRRLLALVEDICGRTFFSLSACSRFTSSSSSLMRDFNAWVSRICEAELTCLTIDRHVDRRGSTAGQMG